MVWDILHKRRDRQRIDGHAVRSLFGVHRVGSVICKMPASIYMNILVPQKLLGPHWRDGADGILPIDDAEHKFLLVL